MNEDAASPRADRDAELITRITERWLDARNRKQELPGYRDEWWAQQCGGCRFWLALSGEVGLDFGVCANERSPFFMRVQFEHDGCDFYEPGGEWHEPVPEFDAFLEREKQTRPEPGESPLGRL